MIMRANIIIILYLSNLYLSNTKYQIPNTNQLHVTNADDRPFIGSAIDWTD